MFLSFWSIQNWAIIEYLFTEYVGTSYPLAFSSWKSWPSSVWSLIGLYFSLIWIYQKVVKKGRIYQGIWKLSAKWMSVFPKGLTQTYQGIPARQSSTSHTAACMTILSWTNTTRSALLQSTQYFVPGFAVMCRALWEERNNWERAPVEMLHLWVEWKGKEVQAPSQLCSDLRGKEEWLLHVQKRRFFIA